MKSVRTSKKYRPKCGGCYGIYLRLNRNRGVKIMKTERDTFVTGDTEYTIEDEYKTLKKLNRKAPGIWPKCYGLVKIFYKKEWHTGILMEHIQGKPLESFCCTKQEKLQEKIARFFDKLEDEYEVIFEDNHNGNIFVTPGNRIRLIDAGPQGVSFYD